MKIISGLFPIPPIDSLDFCLKCTLFRRKWEPAIVIYRFAPQILEALSIINNEFY